jgi:hypothetical protein
MSLVLALGACLDMPQPTTSAPVLRQATLADGAVVLRPPAGYCIDARSFSDRPRAGFALIGSCASLTGEATGVFVEPAIISVSVSPAVAGQTTTDSRAFQTALGRGSIIKAVSRDDLSLLQVEGGARIPPSADQRHWRGLMEVEGQVLGLALYAATDSPMLGDQGMRLLVSLADGIRRDSPARTVAARPAPAAE